MICPICNTKDFYTNYDPHCQEKRYMDQHGVCFGCAFWSLIVEGDPNEGRKTVIAGIAYSVQPDVSGDKWFAGFGGREFNIEYFSGEKVTTHNLWCRGVIPEYFREKLPNTAKFA